MNHTIFEQLGQFQNAIIQATLNSPFYQNYGLIVVLIYAATPSLVPIPNEAFWIPLYTEIPVAEQQTYLVKLILFLGIMGFIGDSLIFFAARHGVKYFIKHEVKAEKEMNHWLHKYKHLIFTISPNVWMLPGVPELILVGAAVKHVKYTSFWHYLLFGNIIRNVWGVALVVSGIDIFGVMLDSFS